MIPEPSEFSEFSESSGLSESSEISPDNNNHTIC